MNNERAKLPLIAILIIFPLLVVGISMNIGSSLGQSVQGMGPTRGQTSGETMISSSTTLQNGNATKIVTNLIISQVGAFPYQFLYFGLAGLLIAASLIFLRSRQGRKTNFFRERRKDSNRLLTAIAFAYLALIIVGIWLASRLTLPVFSGFLIGNIDWKLLAQLSLTLGVLLSTFFVLLILVKSGRLRRVPQTPAGSSSSRSEIELKEIIDRAIRALQMETGCRPSIIECYKQVLAYLERKGIPQKANLTPREFEIEIREGLGRELPQLHELTDLFEKARYSNEELSPNEVEQARRSLERISSDFGEQTEILLVANRDRGDF